MCIRDRPCSRGRAKHLLSRAVPWSYPRLQGCGCALHGMKIKHLFGLAVIAAMTASCSSNADLGTAGLGTGTNETGVGYEMCIRDSNISDSKMSFLRPKTSG